MPAAPLKIDTVSLEVGKLVSNIVKEREEEKEVVCAAGKPTSGEKREELRKGGKGNGYERTPWWEAGNGQDHEQRVRV